MATQRSVAIERTCRVLNAMLESERAQTMPDIVASTRLNRETVRRTLNVLRTAGLCRRSSQLPRRWELALPLPSSLGAPTAERSAQALSCALSRLQDCSGLPALAHAWSPLTSTRWCQEVRVTEPFLTALATAAHTPRSNIHVLYSAPLRTQDAVAQVIAAHTAPMTALPRHQHRVRTQGWARSSRGAPDGWEILAVPLRTEAVPVAGTLSLAVPCPILIRRQSDLLGLLLAVANGQQPPNIEPLMESATA